MSDPVRVALNKTALTKAVAGRNLTDASFATMVAGAGAGVTWTYASTDIVVLKNATGAAAIYTIIVQTPAQSAALGLTLTNPTIEVADGKTVLLRVSELWRDSTRKCAIDCDKTANILVLDVPA